ncbi:hypothetical protein BGZ67_010560 [Mortierella alpina]|nr:hypothetical protein BGZ67_010560 [Mortierella alpina]
MSITSDNGSNVLRLTSLFEDYTRQNSNEWRYFKASEQHVPCLAHVLNLAVQAILGKGGLGAQAPADAESMDAEDENDDSEGLIRTSIVVEDESDEDGENLLMEETVDSIDEATIENLDHNYGFSNDESDRI